MILGKPTMWVDKVETSANHITLLDGFPQCIRMLHKRQGIGVREGMIETKNSIVSNVIS